MAGSDVAYHNTGVTNAEAEGTKLHDGLAGQHPDAKLAGKLSADANHFGKNATERQAFWSHVIGSSTSAAEAHLPKDFQLSGSVGGRTVKDDKGHVIYDEAKTAKQADKDGKIHDGQGPYQAFRRQGMTDEEAKKAAQDVKATTQKGDKGFKAGDSYKTHDQPTADGQHAPLGDWHDKERFDKATGKAQDNVIAEQKKIDGEQKEVDQKAKALKDQEGLVSGSKDLLDKFGKDGSSGKYLYKDDLQKLVDNPPAGMTQDQIKAAQYMNDPANFDKMAGSNTWFGSKYINPSSLGSFTQQEQQGFTSRQNDIDAAAAALAERRKVNFT